VEILDFLGRMPAFTLDVLITVSGQVGAVVYPDIGEW